jgi:transcriptional regulator with XRE-family HTH domain
MTNTELKEIREALNLSQTKMGKLLGMRQPNYCRLENKQDGRQPTKQQTRAVEILQIIYEQKPELFQYILARLEK